MENSLGRTARRSGRPELSGAAYDNPLPQKLPIAPIFTADSISLAVSGEKDEKLRTVCAGSDDAKVFSRTAAGKLA